MYDNIFEIKKLYWTNFYADFCKMSGDGFNPFYIAPLWVGNILKWIKKNYYYSNLLKSFKFGEVVFFLANKVYDLAASQ